MEQVPPALNGFAHTPISGEISSFHRLTRQVGTDIIPALFTGYSVQIVVNGLLDLSVYNWRSENKEALPSQEIEYEANFSAV